MRPESIAYFGNPIEPQLNRLWVDALLIAKPIGKGLGRHPAMRERSGESGSGVRQLAVS